MRVAAGAIPQGGSLLSRGMAAVMVAQFLSAAADNALLFGAIGLLLSEIISATPGARSPWLIGLASDEIGLRVPVLVTGCLLAAAGTVLLAGRSTLVTDLGAARPTVAAPARTAQ